jgi:hypothetical protein
MRISQGTFERKHALTVDSENPDWTVLLKTAALWHREPVRVQPICLPRMLPCGYSRESNTDQLAVLAAILVSLHLNLSLLYALNRGYGFWAPAR